MSVQVSYKKQTVLGIIGLVILFLAIEVIANVWWITQINCEFEENEIFQQMDDAKKRQLCVDLYDIKTSGTELIPNQQNESISINSLGFRGDEFSAKKSDTVYRIFMLGGSTMFGHGATSNETTIPGYIQEFFQNSDQANKIEIINSGIHGADSFTELKLIEMKLLDFSPDMMIIYDGWNDLRAQNSAETIQNNWSSMCQLGMQNNFDVIIALQPIAGFGNKILTEQELEYSISGIDYQKIPLINSLSVYEKYTTNLETLTNCTANVNLRTIFDTETSPIYWDQGHVSDKGNSLIAKVMYNEILQILPENLSHSIQINNNDNLKENMLVDNQLRYLLSGYKTPIMINAIFSLEKIEQKSTNDSRERLFETQSKIYDGDEISIIIEILNNEDSQKKLKIRTINNNNNSYISNVTYFLKILKNDKTILSDFFYVEKDVFVLDIATNNSDSIKITGKRQYDHNAIIASVEPPIKISGPILENNINYDFNIELRTIYDKSNWVFSLDNFQVEVTP